MLKLLKLQKYGWPGFIILMFVLALGDAAGGEEEKSNADLLLNHCAGITSAKIERISEHVWAAIGYDLANEILIQTDAGIVIIDPLMNLQRAESAQRDLLAAVPGGPVKAIIYTHSHIDHIGGASLWVKDDPEIWATAGFRDNFFKQYQVFLPVESMRGKRQFGYHVSSDYLPCNGIGPHISMSSAEMGKGIRLPSHTFSGTKTLNIGGINIELIEAHGETSDQLIIWVPQDRTLIAADNFYEAFPNLYTIRGTSARPVDQWIGSIDIMRKLRPQHLVPCHTLPLHGAKEIAATLADYRDAIQWVRDEVIREANKGRNLDELAESIKLPAHLAGKEYLQEFYGQVDWSARGIYTSNLGWFDGRPDKLYPLNVREAASREIILMGGCDVVINLADKAIAAGDWKWSVHLLTKLADSGLIALSREKVLKEKLAISYEGLASSINNSNGRGYLLESAYELRNGPDKPSPPMIDDAIATNIPLESIFAIMPARLIVKKAMDITETVYFVFPDENKRFIVTVRRGIAEVIADDPLPGTPEPVAILTVDAMTFRKMALKISSPFAAYLSGKIKVEGSWLGFIKWYSRFGNE